MKKKLSLFSIIVIGIIAFSLFFTVAQIFSSKIKYTKPEGENLHSLTDNIKPHSTYARDSLAEHLRPEYDKILRATLTLSPTATIKKIKDEELTSIFYAILADNPLIDWLSREYSFKKTAYGVEYVLLNYTKTRDVIEKRLAEISKCTDKFFANFKDNASEYEKAKYIHDKIINECVYDLAEKEQSELYAVLVKKRATCEGYAKAFQFLTNIKKMKSIVVYGTAKEPHAWNKISVDNEYYFVDVTFDDREVEKVGTVLVYDYFLLTDEDTKESHVVSQKENHFPLPKCTSTKNNYFVKEKLIVTLKDDFIKAAKEAVKVSGRIKRPVAQIKFNDKNTAEQKTFYEAGTSDIDKELSIALKTVSNGKFVGRSYDDKTRVMTFIMKYN
ncbi:MAG: transglutaminase domain-containing protein [Oscillospiraceae bacterium]